MNAAVWVSLVAVLALAVFGGWLAAEVSCRARWRRYGAAKSMALHGRAPGRRQGHRHDGKDSR